MDCSRRYLFGCPGEAAGAARAGAYSNRQRPRGKGRPERRDQPAKTTGKEERKDDDDDDDQTRLGTESLLSTVKTTVSGVVVHTSVSGILARTPTAGWLADCLTRALGRVRR